MSEEMKRCEVCGGVGTVLSAYDETFNVHWFCSDCADDGSAIAYLEQLAG